MEHEALSYGQLGRAITSRDTFVAPDLPVTDEAERALNGAEALHMWLDDLENRLFGPELRAVACNDAKLDPSRPPIARPVRHARQRVESANERLNAILARL